LQAILIKLIASKEEAEVAKAIQKSRKEANAFKDPFAGRLRPSSTVRRRGGRLAPSHPLLASEASQASRSDAQGVTKRRPRATKSREGDLSRLQEFDSRFLPKPRSINYQGAVLLQARDFLSRSQVSRILVCDGGK